MKKIYLLILPIILIFGACSLFDTRHRYDAIKMYAVGVPYLSTNQHLIIDSGSFGDSLFEMRFIILDTEAIRGFRYDSDAEYGHTWVPKTTVSIIMPDGPYCIDGEGKSYEFAYVDISEYVDVSSEQKMKPEWFITAVDSLNVNGSNYTVYRKATYDEMRSNMDVSQIEAGGPGISWSALSFSAQSYFHIPTNYYVFTVGNSSNAIPAFAAEYTNVTVNATTYALHCALEQKYYPSNGKIVVTVNGWTTNTN